MLNTAALIFSCVVALVQPAHATFPVIKKDSHWLSMHHRWGNFNLATKTITFREGWDAENLDAFDSRTAAHEFTRYVYALKFPYQTQDDQVIKSIETKCY